MKAKPNRRIDVESLDEAATRLLEEQRREAALRRESLGPVVEAVGMLRACTDSIRLMLDEIDATVGVHLELLDHVLVSRHGSRWWDRLHDRSGVDDGC
jgi:hypothetical protein